jgi:hypothetical protein
MDPTWTRLSEKYSTSTRLGTRLYPVFMRVVPEIPDFYAILVLQHK